MPNHRKTYYLLVAIAVFFLACSQSQTTSEQAAAAEEQAVDAGEDGTTRLAVAQDTASVGAIVYVTSEGDKYHTADCRYSKDAQAIQLVQAKSDGKAACGVCKPNSKTGEKQVRCAGTTADGTQCKRYTSDQSGKCFQHRGT